MTSANQVKQIPFSPNLATTGLTSQESGQYPFNFQILPQPLGSYVAQRQSPVAITRNSPAVTSNLINADQILVAIDEPAFADIGVQVGRQKINSLSNTDMRNGTVGYTLTDPGGIVTAFTTDVSGISESDTAMRITMDNITAGVQFVTIEQPISGALVGEIWAAQAIMKEVTATTGALAVATTMRIFDNDNTILTSSAPITMPIDKSTYFMRFVTQNLVGNSNDLRWSLQFQAPIGGQLDILVTNTSLSLSTWPVHYIPSATGPTTREADVIDVTTTDTSQVLPLAPFFEHNVDEMWSIDFKTLGTLSPQVGSESKLQYLFSSYDGVNGTNLFVDITDTITWQADFNGSLENVVIAGITDLGQDFPFRVYMRTLDDGGGGYDRQMFVENLEDGTITASTVLNTTNLPIQGATMKIGRDDADANGLDGFIGRLTFWGNRSNPSMNRINDNWPTP